MAIANHGLLDEPPTHHTPNLVTLKWGVVGEVVPSLVTGKSLQLILPTNWAQIGLWLSLGGTMGFGGQLTLKLTPSG